MGDLIKRVIKDLESKKRNVYFINDNPVDDIPCELDSSHGDAVVNTVLYK